MKKKISLLLCILLASTLFVGCSNKDESIDEVQKANMISQSQLIVDVCTHPEQCFGIGIDEYIEQIEQYPEFDMNLHIYSLSQYLGLELKVGAEEYVGIFKAWDAAVEECGAYESHGDFEVEPKGDEFMVTTTAQYEDREATILFTFDETMAMKSMDVSAKFELSEILTKAGLNTLLGMGTVFAVLIFLAFLIASMQYIPAILDKFTSKSEQTVAVEQPAVEETVVVETPVVGECDDLELIAVITAAIAAQEGTSTDGFVVRSIRRRPSNNWI